MLKKTLCAVVFCVLLIECILCSLAKKQSGNPGEDYFILLMLTDGSCTDMPQTCEAIVNVMCNSHAFLQNNLYIVNTYAFNTIICLALFLINRSSLSC